MKNELISIIMPVRNGARYLEDCLNSILSQDYQNWELIVVNDHSLDGTEDILITYSNENPRIKFHNNQGKGIIDALKYGYSFSIGDYITRMDADDIMPSYKLSELKNLFNEKRTLAVSTGLVQYFSENTINAGYKNYEDWLNKLCLTNSHYKEIYKECVIPSPCWMMLRKDFEQIGGFDSERYPEDYDLAFRMYKNKVEVISSKKVLHQWRDHDSRASRTDENYTDNTFIPLKVHYFLTLECKHSDSHTVLWGAGKKGKRIAQILLSEDANFDWTTDNPNKIGVQIYGKELKSSRELFIKEMGNINFIIAVANKQDQQTIARFLTSKDVDPNRIFWFC